MKIQHLILIRLLILVVLYPIVKAELLKVLNSKISIEEQVEKLIKKSKPSQEYMQTPSQVSNTDSTSAFGSKCSLVTLACAIYSIVLFFSLMVQKIIEVSKYTGCSCSNYISIIAPAIFILHLSKSKWYSCEKLFAFIIVCFGFGILITFFINNKF